MKLLYVDVDGTLVGPGGDLLAGGSARVVAALLRAREAGLAVVPVSGRGRTQVFELCRLLGFPRGIAELGCVHVEGRAVSYHFGGFPFVGETPVEAMHGRGAIGMAQGLGLSPFDPWNEGREATFLFRSAAGEGVDLATANADLAAAGLSWCELVDNGRAVHLAPAGTGKAYGVRRDREQHGVDRAQAVYVGDTASDLACAAEVGELWLVANADRSLEWPQRTTGAFGDGVAEVIDGVLKSSR